MLRLVPETPRFTIFHRQLARLPAGTSTGMACAAAAIVCALGFFVIAPAVMRPAPFRDDRAITSPSETRSPAPDHAAASATAKPVRAVVQVVVAVSHGSTGVGTGPTTPTAPGAANPPATRPPDPTSGPAPRPTPEPRRSVEPGDRRDGDDHDAHHGDGHTAHHDDRDSGRRQGEDGPEPTDDDPPRGG